MADGKGVGGVFSGIVDKVSFLGQLPLLSRATADDDEPVHGYWLEEIKVGCEPHSVQLADFLTTTLNHRSGRVKLKALRLMEFMSQHDIAFRQAVSRDEGCLKEAMKWLGPVGGGLQEAVRSKATRLLESLHDPDFVLASGRLSMPGLGTSIGSPTGKMEGFGRSRHREETATEKVRGLLDSLFGPSESQSERAMREAFASDKGQYQRIPIDQSQLTAQGFNQSQLTTPGFNQSQSGTESAGQSESRIPTDRNAGDAEEIERFCSERQWPVSRLELQQMARLENVETAAAALLAVLDRGSGVEMRALLLAEILLRRGASTNQLRVSVSRLSERSQGPAALKARKVMLLMDAIDCDNLAR